MKVEYADGIYHATARGIERGRSVRKKVDREWLLKNQDQRLVNLVVQGTGISAWEAQVLTEAVREV